MYLFQNSVTFVLDKQIFGRMKNEKNKSYPCADCKMRRKYEENPKSFIARFWHWHTGFCPGWRAYFKSLSEEEQAIVRVKYHLK